MDISSSKHISNEKLDVFLTCMKTFDQYYPNAFSITSNKTLIIPSSNDLADNYFYGKFDDDDHPSKYEPAELSKQKKAEEAKASQLAKDGYRLLRTAEHTTDKGEKDRMILRGNELVEKMIAMKADIERSDQPWNKLPNIQKHREKDTVTKLINAFRSANIGGILIISPKQNEELHELIENECKNKYPEWKEFPVEFKKYPEICDCIYFHNVLGIYTIEVKATKELKPMTIGERQRLTKEKAKNNAYEKAVYQLARMQMRSAKKRYSTSLLQKLYVIITGSRDSLPTIQGIVCTPEAKISEVKSRENLDTRFHHFDADLLSSVDAFQRFWQLQINCCRSTKNRFVLPNFRKFIALMAYCSVGRNLFGVKNALSIATMIADQRIDPTTMATREYMSENRLATIYLSAMQVAVLSDVSKKCVFGPPGTGKTMLVTLAAIDAAHERQRSALAGKVIVFTKEEMLEQMRRTFAANRFNESQIEVRDLMSYGEIGEYDDIFVDEMSVDNEVLSEFVRFAKKGKLLIAISGQGALEALCFVGDRFARHLEQQKFAQAEEFCIYPLTEILRGTKSIVNFWLPRLHAILPDKMPMACAHSIEGESVDFRGNYASSHRMMSAIVAKVIELMRNNEQPTSIAVICTSGYELNRIAIELRENGIAFGSAADQLTSPQPMIAVELAEQVYSREWPFVIFAHLFPFYSDIFPIIASSRAIGQLTFFERDHASIRSIVAAFCDDDEIRNEIQSSFDDYTWLRNRICLPDDEYILSLDLSHQIITNNYLPPQLRQIFVGKFDTCNSLVEFFEQIVNNEQWLMILLLNRWEYFQYAQRPNAAIYIRFECKPSRHLIDLCEHDEFRRDRVLVCIERALDFVNNFMQPNVVDEIQQTITANRHLFDAFEAHNCVHQFELTADAIQLLLIWNGFRTQTMQVMQVDASMITESISKLLDSLKVLADAIGCDSDV